MSFRLSVHQFFVGQKEITTNHFAPKIQLFTKANFSEKDVWEFRPHRTRGAPWALKDRLHRLWKIGHPRWWYWWRFGISREWTCTDVRKVPSDCDVDDNDVDDDPIGQVRKRVVILRILMFSTRTKSTIRFVYMKDAKEKKMGTKWIVLLVPVENIKIRNITTLFLDWPNWIVININMASSNWRWRAWPQWNLQIVKMIVVKGSLNQEKRAIFWQKTNNYRQPWMRIFGHASLAACCIANS